MYVIITILHCTYLAYLRIEVQNSVSSFQVHYSSTWCNYSWNGATGHQNYEEYNQYRTNDNTYYPREDWKGSGGQGDWYQPGGSWQTMSDPQDSELTWQSPGRYFTESGWLEQEMMRPENLGPGINWSKPVLISHQNT